MLLHKLFPPCGISPPGISVILHPWPEINPCAPGFRSLAYAGIRRGCRHDRIGLIVAGFVMVHDATAAGEIDRGKLPWFSRFCPAQSAL